MHGKIVLTLEGGIFMSGAIQIIYLVESSFSPNAETAQIPARNRFQSVQFGYIKQVIPGIFLKALVIPLSSL